MVWLTPDWTRRKVRPAAEKLPVSATTKFQRRWEVSAEYLLTDSTVLRFPANRSLEGLLIPQVPCHQFNFQVSYTDARWMVGAQGRFVSRQFDDDQNTLPLKRFFTLDADWVAARHSACVIF